LYISPCLYKSIKDFISRKGKRVRPILFVIGYLGFSRKVASGLYRSALSIELLHDFMLVHDDIIDKSDTRRGKPSMHKMFNDFLKRFPGIKFTGEDLTIVAGDVMFALGIHAFLSIQENLARKEKALRKLIEAALYTGSGEFIELLSGTKPIDEITKQDIYKIYDYKTANYTFAAPLAIGATLGGAAQKETNLLFNYGIQLGRAFQIKDDILGMFSDEKNIGKSTLTDLQEAKKTMLIVQAYNHSHKKEQSTMRHILSKKTVTVSDLRKVRKIVTDSGALDYARQEVERCVKRAQAFIERSAMRRTYKLALSQYAREILDVQ